MKPIIGISSSLKEDQLYVPTDNIHAIEECGGVSIVLPNIANTEIDTIASKIDGLLLTGGGDIDPTLFGEEPHNGLGAITPERDAFEIKMIEKMLQLDKPILGICRGAQILNIAAGGDMYQDIHTQIKSELIQHTQNAPRFHASHYVQVMKDSLLYKITQTDKIKVNSFHHQANRQIPVGFEVTGLSNDGVIESFESKNHRFVMGIQWHPECLLLKKDPVSADIFKAFVDACTEKN